MSDREKLFDRAATVFLAIVAVPAVLGSIVASWALFLHLCWSLWRLVP